MTYPFSYLPSFFLFFLFAFVRCVYRSVYVSVCLSRLFPASFPLHCAPRHLDYVTSADVTQRGCRNTWNGWPQEGFLTLFTTVVKTEATCPPLSLHGRGGTRKKADGWSGDMVLILNRLTPNDPYMGPTAPLTSKRCILYIYSTNIGTEYFILVHALYSPFFSLQNAVCFIMLTSLVPILFTFYIQNVLKLKK